MNVTKRDLCIRIKKRVRSVITTDDIKTIVELLVDEVFEALSKDNTIELRGFGTFKAKAMKKRIGRNPRTGLEVPIPAHTIPVFKFSKDAQKNFQKILSAEERKLKRVKKKKAAVKKIIIPNMEKPVVMETVQKSPPVSVSVSPPPTQIQAPAGDTSIAPPETIKSPSLADIAEAMIRKGQGPKIGTIEVSEPIPRKEPAAIGATFTPG